MTMKTKALVTDDILAVFDTVIPIPFTALTVIDAILKRPPWLIALVEDVYGDGALRRRKSGPRLRQVLHRLGSFRLEAPYYLNAATRYTVMCLRYARPRRKRP